MKIIVFIFLSREKSAFFMDLWYDIEEVMN